MAGIYGITHSATGRVYVGKATDPKDRFRRHRYILNAGKHWNLHLQRSWNKHGKDAFKFEVFEECGIDKLPLREQAWIDKLSPNLYNVDMNVADKRHDRNSFFGKKHTEETRKKMKLAKTGKYLGTDNPNYGKVVNPEIRKKMGINRATKLTVESVIEIKRQLSLGHKHQDIANQFGVVRTVVTRIANGQRWQHVTLAKG